jgi:hypothetical protein
VDMSDTELDRIERLLEPLAASEACSPHVKEAVRRFNASVEQERSRLDAARAAYRESGAVPVEVAVALQAVAVMYSVERDRIVQRFRFVPVVGD